MPMDSLNNQPTNQTADRGLTDPVWTVLAEVLVIDVPRMTQSQEPVGGVILCGAVLCDILPEQEAGQRLGVVQATEENKQQGDTRNRENTKDGQKANKLFFPTNFEQT